MKKAYTIIIVLSLILVVFCLGEFINITAFASRAGIKPAAVRKYPSYLVMTQTEASIAEDLKNIAAYAVESKNGEDYINFVVLQDASSKKLYNKYKKLNAMIGRTEKIRILQKVYMGKFEEDISEQFLDIMQGAYDDAKKGNPSATFFTVLSENKMVNKLEKSGTEFIALENIKTTSKIDNLYLVRIQNKRGTINSIRNYLAVTGDLKGSSASITTARAVGKSITYAGSPFFFDVSTAAVPAVTAKSINGVLTRHPHMGETDDTDHPHMGETASAEQLQTGVRHPHMGETIDTDHPHM